MKAELILSLLVAGTNTKQKQEKWDIYQLSFKNNSVLFKVTREASKSLSISRPDYLCALRSSGLVMGVLLSYFSGIPLLWFREPSVGYLFPRNVNLYRKSVVMIDSHTVRGGTIVRCGSLLLELGAELQAPFVLVDCGAYCDPQCREFFDSRFGRPRSVIFLPSLLERKYALPYDTNSDLQNILKMIEKKKENFWKDGG